jgi:PAS domain S-box-containing protein
VNILIVEDNPGDILLLKTALSESSYHDAVVKYASTIEQSKEHTSSNIELVLVDLGLPDSDGLDTVMAINELYSESAIIVLTGMHDEQIAIHSLREGAQNYLNKSELSGPVIDRTIRYSFERHQIIQKLRATDKKLLQHKIFLERAQQLAHIGSWKIDLVSNTIKLSTEARRLFGMDESEFITDPVDILQRVHEADRLDYENKLAQLIKNESPFDFIHRIMHEGGIVRWVHSQAEWDSIKTSGRKTIIGSIQDITESKESEDKIKKGNRLYSFISHINQAIVLIKDASLLFDKSCEIAVFQGQFCMAWIGLFDDKNRTVNLVASCKMPESVKIRMNSFEYEPNGPIEKVLNGSDYHVVNDISTEAGMKWAALAKENGFLSCITLPISNSKSVIGVFNIYSSEKHFFDKEEVAMLHEVSGDISFALNNFDKENLRKQVERDLEKSESRLREAQFIALIGSWEIDLRTNQLFWSDSLYVIFGIDHSAPVSRELFESMIHPDDRDSCIEGMNSAFDALQNSSFNFRFIKSDGELRYGYAESRFEFDNKGTPLRIFGIVKDITQRMQDEIERERIIDDIIQRNKDLEQFAYIVSHNLRLPVANIIGLTEVLKNEALTDVLQKEFIDSVYDSAHKLDEVVKDLNHVLTVRREVDKNKDFVHFQTLVDDISDSIRNIIESTDSEISTDFSEVEGLFTLKGYLYSVFYNLISNSIKYRKAEVKLRILIQSFKKDGKIVLEFTDNGSGIDLEKHQSSLFGLYKRFHQNIEGKGMGLYMVKSQVESLGGKISVTSNLNVGTTFRLEFTSSENNL